MLEKYSWTQQLADLQIVVPVPPGTKTRDLKVTFSMSEISVGLKGSNEPLLGGKLHKKINLDESFWTLEDGKEVRSTLEFRSAGGLWSHRFLSTKGEMVVCSIFSLGPQRIRVMF